MLLRVYNTIVENKLVTNILFYFDKGLHFQISFLLLLQEALLLLWRLAYPDRELPSLKSDVWKEMGWQGSDPSTDFRCVVKSYMYCSNEMG